MGPAVCVFITGAVRSFLRADMLDHSCLDGICESDMPETRSDSDTRPVESGTIILHHRACESHTLVIFGVVDIFPVSVLLRTTFINRFIKFIYSAERMIVRHSLRLVLILIMLEAWSTAKNGSF